MRTQARFALALLLLALAAACDQAQPEPVPVNPQWKSVDLPLPPGPTGRVLARDAVRCGDRWYVGGGVGTPAGDTRPALWSTADATGATSWASVPVDTANDYYAIRSVLYALGCRDGRIAAIGAKSGGAHGNPRVRTFYSRADGALVAVPSRDFELYGGAKQVSVNRIASGPAGWLIAGNRAGGATVWTSPDATAFTIHEDLPALANSPDLTTFASDLTRLPAGWLVVGGGRPAGRIDRDPYVWTSADANVWNRVPLPGTPDDETAQRLARTPDGLIALGTAGTAFAAWPGDAAGTAGGWSGATRFGATGTGAVAAVDGVAVLETASRLVVSTVGADGHRLWTADLGGKGWQSMTTPVQVGPGGNTAVTVGGAGDTMLLLTDDGTVGGLWASQFPPA
ncbi:hypothetical protein SAMN05421812_13712 [Asanoa hainanensis]|uniref:Galactose oxidase, central domain n=1 Tax=Asanoa hainanensis TaxID=560556 RepID=A0A239PGV0_9ACTN|nr:hypothetical protein [Asanoa hainanensis]SNT66301.1 hypothetical protein SAMN05421812_13712 [Asanoa hainanensis]